MGLGLRILVRLSLSHRSIGGTHIRPISHLLLLHVRLSLSLSNLPNVLLSKDGWQQTRMVNCAIER